MAKKKIHIRKGKTLQGTVSCFFGALVGLCLFVWIMNYNIPIWAMILISASTAVLELVGKGLDNFSILFGIYALSVTLINNGVLL